MKNCNHFSIIALFLLFTGCSNPQRSTFPILQGDYLGQSQPSDSAVLFAPEIISTGMYERDFCVSPDGNEILYSLFMGDWNTIMVTRRVKGIWKEPVVAEFARDTTRFFAEPAMSADGKQLFYLSTKPGWKEQGIWVSERQADESWGFGKPLPENINALGEFYPSLTTNGTLYFCRTDENTGISQILRSKLVNGVYGDPEILPEPINGKGTHFNAFIAPDESYLVGCVSGRDSLNPRKTTYMLFFHNPDDTWREGIDLIRELNLPCNNAISVNLSPDGKYLFFASTRKTIAFSSCQPEFSLTKLSNRRIVSGNGNADIYWMRFDLVLDRMKK